MHSLYIYTPVTENREVRQTIRSSRSSFEIQWVQAQAQIQKILSKKMNYKLKL